MNGLPLTVLVVWVLCVLGWGVVYAGLRRGLHGLSRGPALFTHALTPAAVVLLFSLVGFGSLQALIALTAEWCALLLVTGLRPERLVATGGLGRLGAWAAVTVAGTLLADGIVL